MVGAVGRGKKLTFGRMTPWTTPASRDVPSLRKTTQDQVRKAQKTQKTQKTEKLALLSGPRKSQDKKRALAIVERMSLDEWVRDQEQQRRAQKQDDLYEMARDLGVDVDQRKAMERLPGPSPARQLAPFVGTQRYGSLSLTRTAPQRANTWRLMREAELDARAAAFEARAPARVEAKSAGTD